MRFLLIPFVNFLLLLRALLGLPFRFLASRNRARWVRFKLTGDIPYRPKKAARRWLFGKKVDPAALKSLDDLERAVDRFVADARFEGLVLEFHELELSLPKRRVVAAQLERLRAAGKKSVAYAVEFGNAEYALATAADRVVVAPAGHVQLIGHAANALSIHDALKKVGITPHFFRRGPYKTAPELFTSSELSDIQRATLERWLDLRYGETVKWIADGREWPDAEVKKAIDAGPFSARRAAREGLVDALAFEADLPFLLANPDWKDVPDDVRLQSEGARAADAKSEASKALRRARPVLHRQYEKRHLTPIANWRRFRRPPSVAIVPISGAIASGEGGGSPVGPKVAGSEGIAAALRAAAEDSRTSAIVVAISSPGGSAVASEIIHDEIRRAGVDKPVIAHVDEVAASGGYMAAVAAHEIWADPQALLGSIGVFAGKFEASVLLERIGVRSEVINRGAHSGIFVPTRGLNNSEKAALDAEVEETYQAFLELVARSRHLSKEEVHAHGEGRVFSGEEALSHGLVDKLGSFDASCRRALELAGKSPEGRYDAPIFAARSRRLPLERLMSSLGQTRVYAVDPALLLGASFCIPQLPVHADGAALREVFLRHLPALRWLG